MEEIIYGSPLLAILKTLTISNNLSIILNEKDPNVFSVLKSYVNDFKKNGIRIFKEIKDEWKYKSLETKRKRKFTKGSKPKIIFPESPNISCPPKFKEERIYSNAKIVLYNKDINNSIDEIFTEYLQVEGNSVHSKKPIALFLVDPCGSVSWNKVIQKICDRSEKKQGTDMILNWSWEAIKRNLSEKNKNKILSKIYGIPIENIESEFAGIDTMDQFKDKYLPNLYTFSRRY